MKSKKIDLVISGLRYDNQTNIAEGILEAAAKDGCQLFIFTCDSWGYTSAHYNTGETNIFSLVTQVCHDGVIIDGDTLQNPYLVSRLAEDLTRSRIPTVSLNNRRRGLLFAGMDNAAGMAEVVDHLIRKHKCCRLAFITGPEGNEDSRERLEAFRHTLMENAVTLDPDLVYTGDYHPGSGEQAVDHWMSLGRESFPDAIVCANDEMAIGVCSRLKALGISVPGEVCVTGVDNTFSGRVQKPSLTTVERPEKELGAFAYRKLRSQITTGAETGDEYLPSRAIFRESCGCPEDNSHLLRKDAEAAAGERFVRAKMETTTMVEIIKSSAADFSGVDQYRSLYSYIIRYVEMLGLKDFCLCLMPDICTENESFSEDEAYREPGYHTETMRVPVAIRKGIIVPCGDISARDLLPSCFLEEAEGSYYVIMPLHFQDTCFGYAAMGNTPEVIRSEFLHLFILNICNALENIRKQTQLYGIVKKLDRLWIYDTMTGVMNRAGFFRHADELIRKASENGEKLGVMFADLDGLKGVNDRFGHNAGDDFIKASARLLKTFEDPETILMRYGGDEFVLMRRGMDEEKAEELKRQILERTEAVNASGNHAFRVSMSLGYVIAGPDEAFEIEAAIKAADDHMYLDKAGKRTGGR